MTLQNRLLQRMSAIALLIGLVFSMVGIAVAADTALLPTPAKATFGEGTFTITPETKILYSGGDQRMSDAADYLAGRLSLTFDKKVSAKAFDGAKPIDGAILLTTAGADPKLGDEGYALDVTPKGVVIRAPKAAGTSPNGFTSRKPSVLKRVPWKPRRAIRANGASASLSDSPSRSGRAS